VFWYIAGKSTVSALLSMTHDWLLHLEKRQQGGAVFFDFHKAFDCVPHQPLIDKTLASILISSIGFIVTWQCKQRVVLNGETSESLNVTSGVPQGSILGLLLFLIYIDDITKLSLSDGTKLILLS